MKHLIKFNESYQNIKENIEKIRRSYNDLRYIIEDEGYEISIYDREEDKAWSPYVAIVIDGKSTNGSFDIEEEYEEFLDRIKESLPEFKVDTEEIYDSNVIYKIIFIKKDSIGRINESKSERRNVVRQIVSDIIQIFKTGEVGEYSLPEYSRLDKIVYEFDNLNTTFSVDLKIFKSNKISKFMIDGSCFVEDDIIEIHIAYNPNAFPTELYNLVSSLNELIRHELQHLIQYERGDDQTEDNSSREKYYSTSHEIDAQVAGFKRISKLKGVPFENVVMEWFEKNKKTHKLKKEATKRVIRKILSYGSNKLNESFSFYDKKWENELPEIMSIIKDDKKYQFKRGNVMINADMIQILYNNDVYGSPNTLEFDIYFSFNNNDNSIKLDIDITYGDLMVSEFSIEPPNKVDVIEYTSYHSKFSPGSVFALDNNSLNGLIRYLNKFGRGINLKPSDLKFLDEFDNYDPNNKILENKNPENSDTIGDLIDDIKDNFDYHLNIFEGYQRIVAKEDRNGNYQKNGPFSSYNLRNILAEDLPNKFKLSIEKNSEFINYKNLYPYIVELSDRISEYKYYINKTEIIKSGSIGNSFNYLPKPETTIFSINRYKNLGFIIITFEKK